MRTYKLGLLIALFSLVFGALTVAAQDSTTEVELVGMVEAMSLDTITVNKLVIDVTRAEIKVALQLGVAVKVQGSVLADGSVVAREVKAPQDTQRGVLPGEMEITGLLTGAAGTTMTIAGQAVDVSRAEIKAGVVIGQLVKAHVTLAADGSWVAREVEPGFAQGADDNANANANNNTNANDNVDDNGNANANDNSSLLTGNEIEVVGTLTEAGSDYIVVGGQRISIVGAEIKGQLFLGALVKVHLSAGPNGLVAREVELERERSNDNVDDNGNANSNSNDNVVVAPGNCVPTQPAGWTTYTIRGGDTLARIAQGSGSSIAELAATNCITDPRFIIAGATIFVPRAPVTGSNVNANNNGNFNGNDNGDDNHNGNDNGDDHGNDNNDNGDDHGGNSGSGGGEGNSGSGGGGDD